MKRIKIPTELDKRLQEQAAEWERLIMGNAIDGQQAAEISFDMERSLLEAARCQPGRGPESQMELILSCMDMAYRYRREAVVKKLPKGVLLL